MDKKIRLDVALVQKGLMKTRAKAQEAISSSNVLCNGKVMSKASVLVALDDEIIVLKSSSFVGRGGEKLFGALELLGLRGSFQGSVAADIGASTGGFTQCLLEEGVQKIYCVDVGHGQLDSSLMANKKVSNYEGINVKEGFSLPELVDVMVVDLSFISLSKVIEKLCPHLREGATLLLLFKPQFEAGKKEVHKGSGIIRDVALHEKLMESFLAFVEEAGLPLILQQTILCPVIGKEGNQEYFIYYKQQTR